MSKNDQRSPSEKTKKELQEEFPEHEQPTDEEVQEWVDQSGAPDLDEADVEADGGEIYDPTDE